MRPDQFKGSQTLSDEVPRCECGAASEFVQGLKRFCFRCLDNASRVPELLACDAHEMWLLQSSDPGPWMGRE